MAQSLGPTKPKWGRLAPLPWPIGQGLAYFRKPFHTHVKGGRWSRLMTPEVGEGQEGWLASRPSAPHHLKLVVEIRLTSYKYPPYPP
jgi:hypothetical protein